MDSFDFHWGQNHSIGSQHTINGRHYPLEANWYHFACDDKSLSEAIQTYQNSSDPDYHVLSVISIMFQISSENNPAFDAILNNEVLHNILRPGYDIIDNLNLNDLIPSNLKYAGYYEYEGSLTNPPCTDIVRWYLMKAVGYISEEQLWKFRLLLNQNGDRITNNYRGIQKNVNAVYNCDGNVQTSDDDIYGETLQAKTIFVLLLAGIVSITALLGLCCTKCQNMKLKEELDSDQQKIEKKGYIQLQDAGFSIN